jgi:multicomponent Na+:H+ antiporter subunit E
VKYAITLFVALLANWLLWSGHFNNLFLIGLGVGSCVLCLWIAKQMKIVDEEGVPAHLGIRPFLIYAPWLAKEIVTSNINVAKIILSPVMPLRRFLVLVPARQKSELGRVIFANSITLTPGTVSVRMEGNQILVHGLSLGENPDDMSDNMGERVCHLERYDLAATNECGEHDMHHTGKSR